MKRGAGLLLAIMGFSLIPGWLPGIGSDGYEIILLRRGDANNDGSVDISDAYFINNYLFMGGYAPACMDAADANDDGRIDLADSSYLANWLFLNGLMPQAPGPFTCGQDLTADSLTCQSAACTSLK